MELSSAKKRRRVGARGTITAYCMNDDGVASARDPGISRATRRAPRKKAADARKSKQNQMFNQMYLDFGQKDFGKQITCRTCGMFFTQGQPDDEKEVKERFARPPVSCADAHQARAVLPTISIRGELCWLEARTDSAARE